MIYELDTIESIKIRVSVNQPIDGRPKPLNKVPRSLLPNLIILQEMEEETKTATMIAGCKAIHIKNTQDTQNNINPLTTRRFKLLDFYTITSAKIRSAGLNASQQLSSAQEVIKIFNLTDIKHYAQYVMYFIFGGLETFQRSVDPVIRLSFSTAMEMTPEIGSFDIFRIDYEAEQKNISDSVEKATQSSLKDLNLFNAFIRELNYEPTETTTIQLSKTRLSVKFQIFTDVYELFNGLLLSQNLPFVSVGNFYKVLKTFKPPKDWAVKYEQEDLMVLFVLNRQIEPEKNKIRADSKNYSPVFITPVSINEETHVTNMEMEIESRVDDELKEENLLERIFEAFPFPIQACTYEQKRVEANYLFPAPQSLDIPLFYDMIMNDKLISQLLIIDESVRTFRERGGIFVYFRYNSHVIPKNFMSCRININPLESYQQARAPTLFSDLGQLVISVKMFSVPTKAEAERFRTILNKIFEYYFASGYKEFLAEDYELIFPDFANRLTQYETKQKKTVARRKMLKDYDPDMFVIDYQRFCTHEPTVLETEEAYKEAVVAGYDVMVYPLYKENTVRRAYICKHKNYPYVGLKINSLNNRDKVPFLPCCYTAPQVDNVNRPRWKYEHQEDETEVPTSTTERRSRKPKIFISNKALRRDVYSMLPGLVDKFLRIIDPRSFPVYKDYITFVRQGTIRDKNSILDALIKAIIDYKKDLDGPTQREKDNAREYQQFMESRLPGKILEKMFNRYEYMDQNERIVYLSKIREKLASLLPYNTTAQSTFNMELKTLTDYIVNDMEYLDVKLFWRVLEEVFHVDIFLFQRNDDNPQGIMGSPLFLQEYLQYQRRKIDNKWRFSVLLFETTGGEFDRLDYPQIELIKSFGHSIEDETETEIVIIFSWFDAVKDTVMLSRLRKAFNDMFAYNNHPNHPISNVFTSKPLAQCSDFYGKIRLLQFANDICVLTEPLPALDATDLSSDLRSCKLTPVSINTARAFLRVENVENITPITIGSQIVGLQCIKEDPEYAIHTLANLREQGDLRVKNLVKFYIPIIPVDTEEEKKMVNPSSSMISAPSFILKSSLLDDFNQLARLARYIIEYMLWIFSKWHQANKGSLNDQKYIKRFADEKFDVINNHKYPLRIPRRLDSNLSGLINNGKIIVSKIEIRNRLIYALQIRIKQNDKEVLNYHSRIYIKNYYQDVTDFERQDTNIILFGREMVLSWINSKLPHYILHDRIQHPVCPPSPEDIKNDPNKGIISKKICDAQDKDELIIDPYFLKLGINDNLVYLAQQATDISNALYICKTWQDEHYNPGQGSGQISTTIPFIYIAYDSPYNYTKESINGVASGAEYIVLQYKSQNKIYTLALLPFYNGQTM